MRLGGCGWFQHICLGIQKRRWLFNSAGKTKVGFESSAWISLSLHVRQSLWLVAQCARYSRHVTLVKCKKSQLPCQRIRYNQSEANVRTNPAGPGDGG